MDQPDHITDPQTEPEAAPDPEVEMDTEDEVEDEVNLLALSEILPFSQYRLALSEFDAPPSDRVQFAMDQALIAACERVARILRSDLESEGRRTRRLRTEEEFPPTSFLPLPPFRVHCAAPALAGSRVFLLRAFVRVRVAPARSPPGFAAVPWRALAIALSRPAPNIGAVSPKQPARYVPRACHVFPPLGIDFSSRRKDGRMRTED